jgi:hypothetical protein
MVDDDDDDVRNEYALRIVSQLPDVRADGRLSFPIPDFFQDFIVHPPNPTLTGTRSTFGLLHTLFRQETG